MKVICKITKTITIIDNGKLLAICPEQAHFHQLEIIFHFAGFEKLTEGIFEIYKTIEDRLVMELSVDTNLETMLKLLLNEFSHIVGFEEIDVKFIEFPEIRFSILNS